MKYLLKLLKSAERRFLRAWIVWERPDLAGLPFWQQLNTYIRDTVKGCVDLGPDEPLPALLERALAYDAFESKGHYRAMYMVCQEKCLQLSSQSLEDVIENSELVLENHQVKALAQEAIDQLNKIKNSDRWN